MRLKMPCELMILWCKLPLAHPFYQQQVADRKELSPLFIVASDALKTMRIAA